MEREIHIVLDGPPAHESGRFVEVENADGEGIGVGRWEQRSTLDGPTTWHLILTPADFEKVGSPDWASPIHELTDVTLEFIDTVMVPSKDAKTEQWLAGLKARLQAVREDAANFGGG